ncbi:MAG: hypothetical protein KDD77_17710, partial [Caldilineaceae bacterium]|nr:hypothetical protein [Caldilineaceae bacterium]
ALTGVLLGWLNWTPELRAGLQQLSRKVHFGGMELLFSLALMIWHWRWWRNESSKGRVGRYVVLLLAGTNLLYHFPTLFAVLSHLKATAEIPAEGRLPSISAADFRGLLAQPAVLAQAIHVALASFAVAGVWLIFRADRCANEEDQLTAKSASMIALLATVLQFPVGFWLVAVYPPSAQKQLMGGDMLASVAFVLSMLGALGLLHFFSATMRRPESPKLRKWSVRLTVLIVVVMTIVLQRSRM